MNPHMNKRDWEYWESNKDRFLKHDFIGTKLIGDRGMNLIPSFKRLWLEHVYAVHPETSTALLYHIGTVNFWNTIPRCA